MGGGKRSTDDPIKLLDACLRLARDVLTECENTKMPLGNNVWVFSLLAKIISSGQSARMLILKRKVIDAKLVVRSMLDSCLDILFILNSPSENRRLQKLHRIETAFDNYALLKFASHLMGVAVKDLPRTVDTSHVIDQYAWAKTQHECVAKGNDWPRRWRHLSAAHKIKAISHSGHDEWLRGFDFVLRQYGDAAAHSRSLACNAFVRLDEANNHKYTIRARLPFGLGRNVAMIMEPFVCTLAATNEIVGSFSLGEPFDSRLIRLNDRWQEMIRK